MWCPVRQAWCYDWVRCEDGCRLENQPAPNQPKPDQPKPSPAPPTPTNCPVCGSKLDGGFCWTCGRPR